MTISFADFEKVDVRVGRIVRAEPFPEARKPAYKLHIDFGADIGVNAVLLPGVTVGQVRAQTGFDLLVGEEIEELRPPSAEELAIYRELRDGSATADTEGPVVAEPADAGDRVPAGPA